MTKVKVESWGWLYLVVVKDWGSKKIVGSCRSLARPGTGWIQRPSASMVLSGWSVRQTLWLPAGCWTSPKTRTLKASLQAETSPTQESTTGRLNNLGRLLSNSRVAQQYSPRGSRQLFNDMAVRPQ